MDARKGKPPFPWHQRIGSFVPASGSTSSASAGLAAQTRSCPVVHFNVTAHPTERWTTQQIVEAFPYDSTPRYLIRDRDSIYSEWFRQRVKGLGIEEVIIAPRSPWKNPYCERLIGSIRRECLDHLIILNERHLLRILSLYFDYYHDSRTHLSLARNAPNPREVEPASQGKVVVIPEVGGLHHRYTRAA